MLWTLPLLLLARFGKWKLLKNLSFSFGYALTIAFRLEKCWVQGVLPLINRALFATTTWNLLTIFLGNARPQLVFGISWEFLQKPFNLLVSLYWIGYISIALVASLQDTSIFLGKLSSYSSYGPYGWTETLWLSKESNPTPLLSKTTLQKLLNFTFSFKELTHKTKNFQHLLSWTKLDLGWYKLNTDASVLISSNYAGKGGLIRDSNGSCIRGFSRLIGASTCLLAELGLWGMASLWPKASILPSLL